MANNAVLNLEELFGQRERPKVILARDKPQYELRLPDELDPVDQLKLQKRGQAIGELYERADESEDPEVMAQLAEELAYAFKGWIALLNEDLAEEPLGFQTMMRIITFYRKAVGLADDEDEEAEGEEPSPKEAGGETPSQS